MRTGPNWDYAEELGVHYSARNLVIEGKGMKTGRIVSDTELLSEGD